MANFLLFALRFCFSNPRACLSSPSSSCSSAAIWLCIRHSTATARSQHVHSTATARPQGVHSTVTAQSQRSHSCSTAYRTPPTCIWSRSPGFRFARPRQSATARVTWPILASHSIARTLRAWRRGAESEATPSECSRRSASQHQHACMHGGKFESIAHQGARGCSRKLPPPRAREGKNRARKG